jgi:hypothetical protein
MKKLRLAALFSLVLGLSVLITSEVLAHCDTMSGPVITAAKKALDIGNVNLVLGWVQKKDEPEIKQAFQQTMKVRKLGPDAKTMADMYFFETLVRIHRAGEGAPYDGIKLAGTDLGPAVIGADKSLETGSVESLVKLVNREVAEGIEKRFNHAMELKQHSSESVEASRKYVGAYVEYVHYVEGVYDKAASGSAHHGEAEEKEAPAHHH